MYIQKPIDAYNNEQIHSPDTAAYRDCLYLNDDKAIIVFHKYSNTNCFTFITLVYTRRRFVSATITQTCHKLPYFLVVIVGYQ